MRRIRGGGEGGREVAGEFFILPSVGLRWPPATGLRRTITRATRGSARLGKRLKPTDVT